MPNSNIYNSYLWIAKSQLPTSPKAINQISNTSYNNQFISLSNDLFVSANKYGVNYVPYLNLEESINIINNTCIIEFLTF